MKQLGGNRMDEWHNDDSPLQVLAGYALIIIIGALAFLMQ